VNGVKMTTSYDLLINSRLQGMVYLDSDNKTWIVDSGSFDRSWCGPVVSLADGKALIESKVKP
jgi:hypothetical protein